MIPAFQGRGIGTLATTLAIEAARTERRNRYLHATPRIDNGPSNAVCRKLGFTLLGEVDFEYPEGNPVRGNDWRLDLFPGKPETGSAPRTRRWPSASTRWSSAAGRPGCPPATS